MTTEITEREREFFMKFHALCVDYNVNMYGNAEKVETAANYGMGEEYMAQSFNLSIDNRPFHEVRVNDLDSWGKKKSITSVRIGDGFDLILHRLE